MCGIGGAGLGLSTQTANDLRSQVAVSLVDGGCYGPSGRIRATFDSLMNTNIPVLGTVNRQWADKVLAEYTGQPRNP
jgi:hypothetical protein